MNYKRKKRHAKKRAKSKELNSTLSHWEYGRAIAREVSYRQEFKKEKRELF